MTFPRFPQSKPATPEKLVQNAVIAILTFHGWQVVRNQQGLGHVKGRPDLEAYKNGVTIFVECKAPARKLKNGKIAKGRLSQDQEQYIARLKEQGMTVFVADDSEVFLGQLEELQERLWPGQNIKRVS